MQAALHLFEPLILGPATRVMSLRDGTAKMSKSDASDYSRINLTDGADAIAAKFRKAKTDPNPLPETAAGLAGRRELPDGRREVGHHRLDVEAAPGVVGLGQRLLRGVGTRHPISFARLASAPGGAG